MPTISTFYGVIVRMQSEKGGRHHVPHIHCIYGEYEGVYGLDGQLLEGELPLHKQKLVLAWICLHEDELRADWKLLCDGEQHFRIAPLS